MQHLKLIHILADYPVSAVEHTIYNAVLYDKFPTISIVNSNHPFLPGDITAPGIFLRLIIEDFPENSIHLCMLHIESKLPEKYIFAEYKNRYFLAPDNGLLPLAFGIENLKTYQLEIPQNATDIFKAVYLPCLEKIGSANRDMHNLFEQENNPKKAFIPTPTKSGNTIRLTVLYTDSQGNAYLNIDFNEFNRLVRNNKFVIRLGYRDGITEISKSYNAVIEGQKLALFGLGALLQIAVNCGSAEQYLGLKKGNNLMLEIL